MIIKDKDHSICYIEGASIEETRFIANQLSFYIKGYQFMPSVRAGFSDGKKRFYKVVSTHQGNLIVFPKGLVQLLGKALNTKGISFTREKQPDTLPIPTQEEFLEFVKSLNIPFEPYDYQLKAAFDSIKYRRQINIMCTGSGKSLTIYIILRWLLQNNLKSVVIVPSVSLVMQLFSDFVDYGWTDADKFVHRIGGEHNVKHFDNPITISTWQSLYTSPDLFESVDAILVDEVHTAKAETFEKIIFPSATNAPIRLGFTGTLPKDVVDKLTIISSIGPDKKYISTRQLIDRGLATNAVIKAIFLQYNDEDKKFCRKLKYQEEVKFITEHKKRHTILSKILNKLSESGNTIVLFDRKEHGKEMCLNTFKHKFGKDIDIKELMNPDNPYGIYYVIGDSKASDREKIRKLLEKNTNCILFGTSSILSTGINIKNLHNLVLSSGGKSAIKLNQSIGRLLRLHHSKNTVFIYDIIDDLCIKNKSSTHKNYFYKHFEERYEQYLDNEYEVIEKVIKL